MMSNRTKIDKPARPGAVRPDTAEFKFPVPTKVKDFIFGAVRDRYIDKQAVLDGCSSLRPVSKHNPIGHFKVIMATRGRKRILFVRIASPWIKEKKWSAVSIADYLNDRGIRCQEWLRAAGRKGRFLTDKKRFGFPVQLSASEFEDLELIGTCPEELRRLGRNIGRMHKVLRKSPFSRTIERNSKVRATAICRGLRELKAVLKRGEAKGLPCCQAWISKNKAFIERLLDKYTPDFRIYDDLRCQPIHGDLNAGNVMSSGKGGDVFLDLEEAGHSYFPPLADIAMAIERFILFDAPGKRESVRRLRSFIAGYMKEAGTPFSREAGSPGRQIADMIRQIDYHAVAILLSMSRPERKGIPAEEWDKFVSLEAAATKLEPLIDGFSVKGC